jgi:hypothetical protein
MPEDPLFDTCEAAEDAVYRMDPRIVSSSQRCVGSRAAELICNNVSAKSCAENQKILERALLHLEHHCKRGGKAAAPPPPPPCCLLAEHLRSTYFAPEMQEAIMERLRKSSTTTLFRWMPAFVLRKLASFASLRHLCTNEDYLRFSEVCPQVKRDAHAVAALLASPLAVQVVSILTFAFLFAQTQVDYMKKIEQLNQAFKAGKLGPDVVRQVLRQEGLNWLVKSGVSVILTVKSAIKLLLQSDDVVHPLEATLIVIANLGKKLPAQIVYEPLGFEQLRQEMTGTVLEKMMQKFNFRDDADEQTLTEVLHTGKILQKSKYRGILDDAQKAQIDEKTIKARTMLANLVAV